MKKVIIAGGTGFIGKYISTRFQQIGYEIEIISRQPEHIPWNENELVAHFEKAEVVINLAGKSINCRYTSTNRKAILESRTKTTSMIGKAISKCLNPPELWINASAIGIYPSSVDIPMTEDTIKSEADFLSDVIDKWETTFFSEQLPETRRIALRTAPVLGEKGGALQPLIRLTRLGLGGHQGNGRQIFSWVHIEDYFRSLLFIIENPINATIINCSSPTPISNKSLMITLRHKLHVPIGIPAPSAVIKISALIIGLNYELILKSSYVIPQELIRNGFKFLYPTIQDALDNLFYF